MDIDNGWFETLNYPLIDHQQQTYVTKHDLELLHKKIIATDLIVQKYQDANKALLRLQGENDDLKQQIEQITNECCIFGKQVTECTQECDNLKEQIEILHGEKRELHQQLRLLQDENTNNYHEIMVLKQYESLKEINDQLTKTVDRQQKHIAKLQLQLQRKSPIAYKSNKNKQEPSETDIALTNSQKSVRELKLTLGRLVNFIQSSKIEIPTELHIRPVLKAHGINDDFLEITGEFIRKPVKKISKPVVSQTDDDDDDDDDDFIDVNHTIQTPSINTTIPSVDIIEESSILSKSSSRQQKKKKEIPKIKKSLTKNRRQKDISEKPSTKLDDLANELEIALSQSNQQQQQHSQLSSFLSDDDDEDKTQKSDKQQLPIPIYTPIILQSSIIHPQTNSTISISKDISFFSDDDNDEILQQKLPSSSPVFTPIIEQQQQSINEQTISSLQIDSITPMEIQTSDKPTKYMSFLSEDDDDNNKFLPSISTFINRQQSLSQEYISPLELNQSISNNSKSQSSDKQIQTISKNIQDSLLNEKDQTPSIPINILDSNHIKIVLRLLNILTHIPVPLKPLRLVRHRIQQKKIPEKQVIISTDNKLDHENKDTTIIDILQHSTIQPIKEQLKSIEENNKTSNEVHEEQENVCEEIRIDEQLTIIKQSSITSSSQESTPIIESIQFPRSLSFNNESEKALSPPVIELLKPFQITIISRLLNTLTNLPVQPLILPLSFPLQKRKQKTVVNKSSVKLSHQTSNRMQTRSLSSIRTCIARCNQPIIIRKKRQLISSPINSKRKKYNNEYDLINKFIIFFSKEINDELKIILEQKLYENILLFNDNIYQIISEFMFNKCDIILPLIKHLHPYEESIKILLIYINNKSSIFQQNFIMKLNQMFEYEIKQQQISNNRIKILNRLFFLTCSIFTLSSSVIIYARLFDIGYYLTHDILINALSFITNICSSLISIDSSNILLHQILFDILKENKFNISFEYIENLFITYYKYKYDQEDLIRCFILISRHQSWLWCSNELCKKILFPLLNKIDNEYEQQRQIILIILQYILFIYKDNEHFKQDIIFHNQIEQLLLSLKTMNSEEYIVRDKIFFILHTCC